MTATLPCSNLLNKQYPLLDRLQNPHMAKETETCPSYTMTILGKTAIPSASWDGTKYADRLLCLNISREFRATQAIPRTSRDCTHAVCRYLWGVICVKNFYSQYACTICPICMHNMSNNHAQYAWTIHVYVQCACTICLTTMHNMHRQLMRSMCMHSMHAQDAWTIIYGSHYANEMAHNLWPIKCTH